jgi:hypothetical protein
LMGILEVVVQPFLAIKRNADLLLQN